MTDLAMWPVSSMAPPNDLRRGDIVVHQEHGDRGIVLNNPGEGHGHFVNHRDVNIRITPQATTVTDNSRRLWRVLSDDEATTLERVRSVALRVGAEGKGDESLAWFLLYALMPADVAMRATSGFDEWPDDVAMAEHLAEWLDEMSTRMSNLVSAVRASSAPVSGQD